jgi:hypothetical protein
VGASERELQDIAVVAKSGNKLTKVDLKYGFATGDKLTMPLFRGGVIQAREKEAPSFVDPSHTPPGNGNDVGARLRHQLRFQTWHTIYLTWMVAWEYSSFSYFLMTSMKLVHV